VRRDDSNQLPLQFDIGKIEFMTKRENSLYWSVPCGVWFSTAVKVSVFFPLIVLVLCFRLYSETLGIQVGLVASLVLFFSVLLHEFGHVFAARQTGGSATEILIWPLGGLASVRPHDSVQAKVLTALSGPAFNLVTCSLTAWFVYQSGDIAESLNPFVLPEVSFAGHTFQDVMLIMFNINWVLFAANLIPVFPLDGGRVLETVLSHQMGNENGTSTYIKVGTVVAILLMMGGLLADDTAILFIGAIVLVLNFQESVRQQTMDEYEDSFMGYDFSQGYTSLEKKDESGAVPPAGLMAKWRQRRRQIREARERELDQQIAQQLDRILEKVHVEGIESLSKHERQILDRASARFQQREDNQPEAF